MHENIREMVSLKVGVRLVFFYFLFIFRDTSTRYCNDSTESFNFWRKLGRKLKESLKEIRFGGKKVSLSLSKIIVKDEIWNRGFRNALNGFEMF